MKIKKLEWKEINSDLSISFIHRVCFLIIKNSNDKYKTKILFGNFGLENNNDNDKIIKKMCEIIDNKIISLDKKGDDINIHSNLKEFDLDGFCILHEFESLEESKKVCQENFSDWINSYSNK